MQACSRRYDIWLLRINWVDMVCNVGDADDRWKETMNATDSHHIYW